MATLQECMYGYVRTTLWTNMVTKIIAMKTHEAIELQHACCHSKVVMATIEQCVPAEHIRHYSDHLWLGFSDYKLLKRDTSKRCGSIRHLYIHTSVSSSTVL